MNENGDENEDNKTSVQRRMMGAQSRGVTGREKGWVNTTWEELGLVQSLWIEHGKD